MDSKPSLSVSYAQSKFHHNNAVVSIVQKERGGHKVNDVKKQFMLKCD